MSINNRTYDWEDITVTLPNGTAVGIKEIKYTDTQKVTAQYGKGPVPIGFSRGNYEASGSMGLYREEWQKLIGAIGGAGIYDHKPFTITVNYANDDHGDVTDTLKSVKITKFDGGGGTQGDENVSLITCELVILEPIEWNGKPAKIPK